MNSKEFLNKIITVKIDRPLGSKHPKHNYIIHNFLYLYHTYSYFIFTKYIILSHRKTLL